MVVAQHRNQYHHYSRSKPNGPDRFGSSPSSRDFRGMNCRSFQSGAGILPTPLKVYSTPVTKQPCCSSPSSPKTPSPTEFKTIAKSNPININVKVRNESSLSFSELWAGPTYSNSPPPSSLPIPKFSMRAKRTVSLEFPGKGNEIKMKHPIAKSAPPSPTRDYNTTTKKDIFRASADSATKTLRRILNLDLDDDDDE